MMSETYRAVVSILAVMASACAIEVGEPDDELVEEGELDLEQGDVTEGRLEGVPELERLTDPTEGDTELISSSTSPTWKITVVKAIGDDTPDFGDGNAPDLYVVRYCNGRFTNATPVAENMTSPVWNYPILSLKRSDDYVASCSLELWDKDNNAHDFGGRYSLKYVVDQMLRSGSPSMVAKARMTANDDMDLYIKAERHY